MKESLALFGSSQELVGIVTNPVSVSRERIACLLPNVGLAHRIGPHRLNVRIARKLATKGFVSLRFDLSGIGDSRGSTTGTNFLEQAIVDMRSAMDYLSGEMGIEKFVVFGICSGAANSYQLALADHRVIGVFMFDGFRYPSTQDRLADVFARLRQMTMANRASFFATKARSGLARLLGKSSARIDASIDVIMPPMAEFEHNIEKLLGRGVNVYCGYSASLAIQDRGFGQLSAFGKAPFLQRITYEFMPEVDHTATSLHSQSKLMEAVAKWVATLPS